jgi:hypothetical protein
MASWNQHTAKIIGPAASTHEARCTLRNLVVKMNSNNISTAYTETFSRQQVNAGFHDGATLW